MHNSMIEKIILISVDTLRYDGISASGETSFYKRYKCLPPHTPYLDRFAEEGIFLQHIYSTAPYTSSAHASMLTGLFPPHHGLRTFVGEHLSEDVTTLQEFLKDHGFSTLAGVDFMEMFEYWKLLRGFESSFSINRKDGFQAFRKQLKSLRGEKAFLFLHFSDVHAPYLLSRDPEDSNEDFIDTYTRLAKIYALDEALSKAHQSGDYRTLYDAIFKNQKRRRFIESALNYKRGLIAHSVNLYARGIEKFDRGRFKKFISLLESEGFFKNALLIITADHGEDVENGILGHITHSLTDGVLHIPLIIWCSHGKPDVNNRLGSLSDVAPTVASLAGLEEEWMEMVKDIPRSGSSLTGQRGFTNVYSELWTYNLPDELVMRRFEGDAPVEVKNNLTQVCVTSPQKRIWLNGPLMGDELTASISAERTVEIILKEPFSHSKTAHRLLRRIGLIIEMLGKAPMGKFTSRLLFWCLKNAPFLKKRARKYVYFVRKNGKYAYSGCSDRLKRGWEDIAKVAEEFIQDADLRDKWRVEDAAKIEERLRDLGYID